MKVGLNSRAEALILNSFASGFKVVLGFCSSDVPAVVAVPSLSLLVGLSASCDSLLVVDGIEEVGFEVDDTSDAEVVAEPAVPLGVPVISPPAPASDAPVLLLPLAAGDIKPGGGG